MLLVVILLVLILVGVHNDCWWLLWPRIGRGRILSGCRWLLVHVRQMVRYVRKMGDLFILIVRRAYWQHGWE